MDSNQDQALIKALQNKSRKLVYGGVLVFLGIGSFLQINDGLPNFAGLLVFGGLGAFLIFKHFQGKKLLSKASTEQIERVMETIESKRTLDTRVSSDKKSKKDELKEIKLAKKSDISQGNDVTGRIILNQTFGWGSVKIYENGYIYSSTRTPEPEKLLAITSDTSLMGARPNTRGMMRGGALLTVRTENRVFTIKEWTDSKSEWITPSKLAAMQELVMVGNSVIQH